MSVLRTNAEASTTGRHAACYARRQAGSRVALTARPEEGPLSLRIRLFVLLGGLIAVLFAAPAQSLERLRGWRLAAACITLAVTVPLMSWFLVSGFR